jgi:hypothetical protein
MTPRPSPAALFLLALVACGSVGCDLEGWLRALSGERPGRRVELTQAEASSRPGAAAERDLDAPLRAPEPPPSPRSSFNRMSSSSSSTARKRSASAPRSVARSSTREIAPGSSACENARATARRMEGYVESIEREIERLEDDANDVEHTSRSREYYEERVDAAEQRLEQAEDSLADYIESQRHAGIPHGCLR